MSVQDGCVDLFSGSIRVFVDMDGIQKLKILENVVQWLIPTLSPERSVCCMCIDGVSVCNARTPAHEFFENVGRIHSFHLFHLMRTECMKRRLYVGE